MAPQASHAAALHLIPVCLLALLAALLIPVPAQAGECLNSNGEHIEHDGVGGADSPRHTHPPNSAFDHTSNCAAAAGGFDDPEGAFAAFLNTGLGGTLQRMLQVLVVVVLLAFAGKELAALLTQRGESSLGGFFKKMVPAVVIGAFLFNLSWFASIISVVVQIGEAAVDSIAELF